MNGNAIKFTESTWVSRVNIVSQIFWNTRREFSSDVFSGVPAVKVLCPYYNDREDKNVDISSTKELDEHLMLLSSFFLRTTVFVLELTQAHCPVGRLLETFWTFTSLVVLRHLESIWTLTIVTSWVIDTCMAAIAFKFLNTFINICERPN